jgi:hypothetical protein
MDIRNTSTDAAAPQPDRMVPILLIETLLVATGLVYYFWMYAV